MKIEDQILKILSEDVPYEVVGGPTPSAILKEPLDYTKPVTRATIPQTHPIPGVGTTGHDGPTAEPITDVVDNLDEEEDAEEEEGDGEHENDDDKDDDEKDHEDDKDKLAETFAQLLKRLVEEDEEESAVKPEDAGPRTDEKSTTPKEILPNVDDPNPIAVTAPGAQVAEEEGDEEGEVKPKDAGPKTDAKSTTPKEILPNVDDPHPIADPAPGVSVAEAEARVAEDVKAIFSGHKLSEAAKAKAATIFNAAVTRRVNEEKLRVMRSATSKLTEAFSALKAQSDKQQKVFEEKLSVDVDNYLNYVVENWMTENHLAVERGIRAELAEGFIAGLKKLFVEHYIEVPDSKIDVVATLGNKVTKLESKLNEALEVNIKMRSSLSGYRKEEAVRAVGAGLSDTQRDKLTKLSEGVDYSTRKEFTEKLTSLKESYFPKVTAPKAEESLMERTIAAPASAEMQAINEVLSKLRNS